MIKSLLGVLFALCFTNPAFALCSSVPNSFVPGTLAQSGQVNADFAAVVNCINGLDTSQIISGTLPVARGGTGTTTSTGTGSVVLSNAPTFTGVVNASNGLGAGTSTLSSGVTLGVTDPGSGLAGGAGGLNLLTSNVTRLSIGTTVSAFTTNLNVTTGNVYQSAGISGVTCSGTPTVSFTSNAGIVTHC